MSNITDEKLVAAAVKGDCDAVEELKARIKPRVCDIINKGARSYKGDMDVLVDHTLEKVINSLDSFQFKCPFYAWVGMITRNTVIKYLRESGDYVEKEALSIEELKSNNTLIPEEHLPLEQIDVEIQSLVSLLNQSPDIRTISSCSGHPDRKAWGTHRSWNSLRGGWISIVPTGDPLHVLEFLIGVLTKLNNTEYSAQQREDSPKNAIHQRYQEVDANDLYYSGIPIVSVVVEFSFFACHPEVKHRLEIWLHLITIIRELIPENEELIAQVDTSEKAVQLLEKAFPRIHPIFSANSVTSKEGYPGITLNKKVDLNLCLWFYTLANRLYERLDEAGYVRFSDMGTDTYYAEKWDFSIQPILNPELLRLQHLSKTTWEPRTSVDHLKIWKLLENTVAEQLEHEGVNTA